MERDKIGFHQEVIEGKKFDFQSLSKRFISLNIISNDLHFKSFGPISYRLPNSAKADNSESFSVNLSHLPFLVD